MLLPFLFNILEKKYVDFNFSRKTIVMSSQRVIITGAVTVLVVVLLGAATLTWLQPVHMPEETTGFVEETLPETTDKKEEPDRISAITQEQVEGLYYGLKYVEAEQLFGSAADAIETEYDRGVEGYTSPFVITWYVWNNQDGSKARLGFVKDKLYRKQFLAADGHATLPEPEEFIQLE